MQNEPFDQIDPLPEAPKPKMPLGKAVLINFGVMIGYMLLTSLAGGSGSGGEAGLGVLALDAVLILLQVGINLLLGLVLVFTDHQKPLGSALLISGIIMGVLGFGSCLVHASMIGGM